MSMACPICGRELQQDTGEILDEVMPAKSQIVSEDSNTITVLEQVLFYCENCDYEDTRTIEAKYPLAVADDDLPAVSD